jgi:hypothetical protein
MVPATAPGGGERIRQPHLAARFRALVASGAAVALATDYNPGSSPTLSMQMVMQLAGHLYGFSPAQIWHMVTHNAAKALDRDDTIGTLAPGKRADLVVWDVAEHGSVIDQFGVNLAAIVVKAGEVVAAAAPSLIQPQGPARGESGRLVPWPGLPYSHHAFVRIDPGGSNDHPGIRRAGVARSQGPAVQGLAAGDPAPDAGEHTGQR